MKRDRTMCNAAVVAVTVIVGEASAVLYGRETAMRGYEHGVSWVEVAGDRIGCHHRRNTQGHRGRFVFASVVCGYRGDERDLRPSPGGRSGGMWGSGRGVDEVQGVGRHRLRCALHSTHMRVPERMTCPWTKKRMYLRQRERTGRSSQAAVEE